MESLPFSAGLFWTGLLVQWTESHKPVIACTSLHLEVHLRFLRKVASGMGKHLYGPA